MPGIKPKSSQRPSKDPGPEKGAEKSPRKSRPHGFARQRMTPTRRVEHVLESCPECGSGLTGGWVQLTWDVIDLPVVPAEVAEHVYIARTCPMCEQRRVPPADLAGAALGKQRLGVNLLSLITALREEGRLPLRTIKWYLRTVHQLRLSLGAIVGALQRVAQRGQPELARIVDRIRASPVVHADETGWRQDGRNGYVWTSAPPPSATSCGGAATRKVLVSDFYAAYHHYDGPKQRCWVHLLRDIHDLKSLYPKDQELARWAGDVHRLWSLAKDFTHPRAQQRRLA